MFYNINYRLYKGKVEMESLTKETVIQYGEQLQKANAELGNLIDEAPKDVKIESEKNVKSAFLNLKKGESGSLKITGLEHHQ